MATIFLICIVYLSFTALGLPDSLLGSAWPLMHPELAAPSSFAGVVQMLVSSCTVASSLFSSYFLQRFGTGKVALVSVLSTAMGLLGYSLTQSMWLLLPCAIFLGIGAGAIDASLSNFVALYLPAKHMSWLHCCWGVGAMTSSYIMAYFLQSSRWRWGFRTVSFMLLGIVFCLAISQKLWRIYEKEPQPGEAEEKLVTNRDALKIPGVKSMMLAMLCYNGAEAVGMLWAATYFIQAKGMAPGTAAACCSVFYIGITVGRLFSGAVSERFGDARLIRWGILTALCGILLMCLPSFGSVAGLFLAGFGGAPVFPSIVHATPQMVGEKNSSTAIGLEISAAHVGASCMPVITGFFAERLGMGLIPVVMLAAFLVMLLSTEKASRT